MRETRYTQDIEGVSTMAVVDQGKRRSDIEMIKQLLSIHKRFSALEKRIEYLESWVAFNDVANSDKKHS
jgi:hypothetical protein